MKHMCTSARTEAQLEAGWGLDHLKGPKSSGNLITSFHWQTSELNPEVPSCFQKQITHTVREERSQETLFHAMAFWGSSLLCRRWLAEVQQRLEIKRGNFSGLKDGIASWVFSRKNILKGLYMWMPLNVFMVRTLRENPKSFRWRRHFKILDAYKERNYHPNPEIK